jgi:hypothetical protein
LPLERQAEGRVKRQADHYGQKPVIADNGPLFDVHEVPVRAHMRTVKGAKPADALPGVMASFDADDSVQRAKAYVREKLAELYRERCNAFRMGAQSVEGYVTADDADRLLREWPQFPKDLLSRESQAWRGSIFRGGGWYKTGRHVNATRAHMNGTELPCWALRDAVAA